MGGRLIHVRTLELHTPPALHTDPLAWTEALWTGPPKDPPHVTYMVTLQHGQHTMCGGLVQLVGGRGGGRRLIHVRALQLHTLPDLHRDPLPSTQALCTQPPPPNDAPSCDVDGNVGPWTEYNVWPLPHPPKR